MIRPASSTRPASLIKGWSADDSIKEDPIKEES